MIKTPFIPFIRSGPDEALLKEYYSDSDIVRVTLDRRKTLNNLSSKFPLWIDIALDCLENSSSWSENDSWKKHICSHGDLTVLADESFLDKPKRAVLTKPIQRLLSDALDFDPEIISIPQLPHKEGSKRTKINKLLADIFFDWANRHTIPKPILPIILTHQKQLNKKTARNAFIKPSRTLIEKHSIGSVWFVDSSLEDQQGTRNFERERFPGIISFAEELDPHQELRDLFVGPYWGLGLLMWARGLVSGFGIGLGASYRYHLPGGVIHSPKARVALEPLRRWTPAANGLEPWLRASIKRLSDGSEEANSFGSLLSKFPSILDQKHSRRQVAGFYRSWIDRIASSPPPGRALALFQDLSSAFATGKILAEIPDESGPARRPEKIAEQLMLNCL